MTSNISFNLFIIDFPKAEELSKAWENSSYIPIVSNVKGVVDLFIGTAKLVTATALAILVVAVGLPLAVFFDFCMGQTIFGPMGKDGFNSNSSELSYRFFNNYFKPELSESISIIGRGILESIPVIGNLSLALIDKKITILTNQ